MASINTDIAQTLNITCRRGDTLAIDINFKDSSQSNAAIDISSGFSFQMQVRSSDLDEATTPLLGDETSGDGTHGKITLTPGSSGKLSVLIEDGPMKSIPSGNYVYDIQASKNDGSVQTWVKGDFIVNEDVTIYVNNGG